MSTSEQRIEVFQDTQDWIGKDPDLSASIPVAKKNTTVFYEDDYPALDQCRKVYPGELKAEGRYSLGIEEYPKA